MIVKGMGINFVQNLQLENFKLRMVIEQLKLREKQVILHEMAHKAVGGQYAGAVHYTYTQGPDGRNYITGGEVSIDVSPEADPEETIKKMQIVRAAALAPADPSPQDLAVAQRATALETKARMELVKKRYAEGEGALQKNGSESTFQAEA